jgi:hypothetical protein
MPLTRRNTLSLLLTGLAGALIPAGCARRPEVRHILPTTSHESLGLSVSLSRPVKALTLTVDGAPHAGHQRDSRGRFWSFAVDNLKPGTSYRLELHSGTEPLHEAWPLKTLPHPASHPDRLKILAYTCAGGADGFEFGGRQLFKPLTFRHRLFEDALSQEPDVAIAIGDHIYWDLRGGTMPPVGRRSGGLIKTLVGWYLRFKYGAFDRSKALIGTENEGVLTRIGDEQIAALYGTRFRSVPVFFVSDDHDFFENDDAEEDLVTLPPDTFSRRAHRAVADLYYPPLKGGPSPDMERAFGLLRYGRLFEAPLFDCAGHLGIRGPDAGLVPARIEDWLKSRAKTSDARHFAFVPSHPMGWTAGKWREWYPDVVAPKGHTGVVANVLMDEGVEGELTAEAQKYLWPRAWWDQHQRLLKALYARPGSRFMFSGDIHAQGAVAITKSGAEDLSGAPVSSILVGPVGTSDATWPSAARNIAAAEPAWLETQELAPTQEINGFTILEFDRSGIRARLHDCGGHDRSLGEDGRVQRVSTLEIL